MMCRQVSVVCIVIQENVVVLEKELVQIIRVLFVSIISIISTKIHGCEVKPGI